MPAGLYADIEIIERFLAVGALGALAQPFLAPCDLEVQGLVASAGTAPGGVVVTTLNINVTPTSQSPGVAPYAMWTAPNAPSITGAATKSFTSSQTSTLIKNVPYALGYPLPGASGTSGYNTAQSTALATETPVTAPPTMINYGIGALVAPDNVYTDLNGLTGVSAGYVHAGDVLSFVVGGALGAVANLAVTLLCLKR